MTAASDARDEDTPEGRLPGDAPGDPPQRPASPGGDAAWRRTDASLTDPWLAQALRHAPGHEAAVPQALREQILAQARVAVQPGATRSADTTGSSATAASVPDAPARPQGEERRATPAAQPLTRSNSPQDPARPWWRTLMQPRGLWPVWAGAGVTALLAAAVVLHLQQPGAEMPAAERVVAAAPQAATVEAVPAVASAALAASAASDVATAVATAAKRMPAPPLSAAPPAVVAQATTDRAAPSTPATVAAAPATAPTAAPTIPPTAAAVADAETATRIAALSPSPAAAPAAPLPSAPPAPAPLPPPAAVRAPPTTHALSSAPTAARGLQLMPAQAPPVQGYELVQTTGGIPSERSYSEDHRRWLQSLLHSRTGSWQPLAGGAEAAGARNAESWQLRAIRQAGAAQADNRYSLRWDRENQRLLVFDGDRWWQLPMSDAQWLALRDSQPR